MQGILRICYKFAVVNDTPLGRACFATSTIKKGEIICKMAGPTISLKEYFDKYEPSNGNPLQVADDLYIDLIEPYVCFNHSCNPNSGIRNNGILFALRDIKNGEEIMYDYSTTIDDVTWCMDCRCGSKNCRKQIGDFQSLSHELKEFYFSNNALTYHLTKTYY